MLPKPLVLVGLCFFHLSAHATFFSTEGVVNGSDSFSVTVDGITMTIDNPSPQGLINFPGDCCDGLDFGDASSQNATQFFDVTFDKRVSLISLSSTVVVREIEYSITGEGVASYGNVIPLHISVPNLSVYPLLDGPLVFKAGKSYTFTNTGVDAVGQINGFEVSVVPIPAAVWLFSTALFGLIGIKRHLSI